MPEEKKKSLAGWSAEKEARWQKKLKSVRGKAAVTAPEPVQTIAGACVFLGQYQPKDRDGKSLGKIFNVFASPQDLTDASGKKETYTYVDTVKRIADLKNWYGFDGMNCATDKELYEALRDGRYNGGWVMPTSDLLVGTDVDGNKDVQKDSLFKHQNTGSFRDTFTTSASGGSDCPGWYWSSTENRDNPSCVWSVRFSDGGGSWVHKDFGPLSCRPVRLVEASSPSPGRGRNIRRVC